MDIENMTPVELLKEYALLDVERRKHSKPERYGAWEKQAVYGNALSERGYFIHTNRANEDKPVFNASKGFEAIAINWLGEQVESLYK